VETSEHIKEIISLEENHIYHKTFFSTLVSEKPKAFM
jgi:hypothetical protein